MSNEPILFLKEPGQPYATARLLFVPTRLLSLSSVNGAIEYVEGQDYTWKCGSNLLTLTKDSRIPFKTVAEMHPPVGAPNTLGKTKDGKSSLFFIGNGPEFQNIQPLATYEHKQKWAGHIPPSGQSELGRTIARLSAKRPVKIVVFGDSISTGASASSMFNEFPYQPGYPDIVADGLRFHYGASISVTNLSEGGQDSRWATSQVAKVVAAKPDLVIIGFGMNDASRRFTGEEYAKNIQTVISEIQAALPGTDFILVATMVGNPDWDQTVPELYSQYREVLTRMKRPGIAVADLTTIWQEMLRIKKFDDITANGLNHPNDFGQRIYAHVILQLMQ
jgi:lysophospholipase L1-like esterase